MINLRQAPATIEGLIMAYDFLEYKPDCVEACRKLKREIKRLELKNEIRN